MVFLKQLAPGPISQFRRSFRRADNVGEQDGRQNAIRLRAMAYSREKFFNLIEQRVRIPGIGCMILSRELDQFCAAYTSGLIQQGRSRKH
jgi:hypothetical protein